MVYIMLFLLLAAVFVPLKAVHDNFDNTELQAVTSSINFDEIPIFLEEPSNAYVIRNKPAVLQCRVAHVLQILFMCNDIIQPNVQQDYVDPQSGMRIVEAVISITRNSVEHIGEEKFKCQCFAISSRGKLRSRPAIVEVAYIRKQFESPPYSQSIEVESQVELRCYPPLGVPQPRVYWLRNGVELVPDTNLLVSTDGHILLGQARLHDTANYTCVAENIAGRRLSPAAELIVYVNGGWAPWSPWSNCSAKCGHGSQKRIRSCIAPPPMNGGSHCIGPSVQKINCTSVCKDGNGIFSNDGTQLAKEAPLEQSPPNLTLYISLAVAFTIFVMLSIYIIHLRKRESREHSIYNGASSEFQRDYLNDEERKSNPVEHQSDLTLLSPPPCYQFSCSDICDANMFVLKSCNEQHCHIPYLNRLMSNDIASSLPSLSENLAESKSTASVNNVNKSVNSVYGIRAASLPGLAAEEEIESLCPEYPTEFMSTVIVTTSGIQFGLRECGIFVTIPEGAVPEGAEEEIFLAVSREDEHRPRLLDGETQLSPVILCGPAGVPLMKPVIIQFQHCASLNLGHWSMSVFGSDAADDAELVWQKVVCLGEETINTPVFTQLDHREVFLVTEKLGYFVLIGKSVTPDCRAIKRLRLAVFVPIIKQLPGPLDVTIRVYVLEDTRAALESVTQNETRIGGLLLDGSKELFFEDSGSSLRLDIQNISTGWKCKPNAEYQEIPFDHIWNSTHNQLHCEFTVEHTNCREHNLTFRICASQADSVFLDIDMRLPNVSAGFMNCVLRKEMTVTRSSSDLGKVITTISPFRFRRTVRNKLCQCLDPPNAKSNDWRMLAVKLGVDRYINYFATKTSPTDHILDLWEARHRDPGAVAELVNILKIMGRTDASSIIESEMGSWI